MQSRSDNNLAHCRIYFSVKEYLSAKMAIENHDVIDNAEHIKLRLKEYDKLVSYCLLVKYGFILSPYNQVLVCTLNLKDLIFFRCRHVVISQYFGYEIPPCKKNCDVCKDEEIVEARTAKFIVFSEDREGIKYNT